MGVRGVTRANHFRRLAATFCGFDRQARNLVLRGGGAGLGNYPGPVEGNPFYPQAEGLRRSRADLGGVP